MANFSTNQVKQFYVAKALNTSLTTKGDIAFKDVKDGCIAFNVVGEGGVVRSDVISLNNLISAKAIKSYTENYNSAYVACDTVVAGQQYIIKLNVRQFIGMSDEETICVLADYKAKTNDTAETILYELGKALKRNMSKYITPIFDIYLTTAATGGVSSANSDEVDSATPATKAYVGLVIEAATQDYRRGIISQDNVFFDVTIDKIISAGNEVAWATITKNADHIKAAMVNSKKIADLEYFCMGERGDMYRGVGFPNNIETKYMVDPEAQYGYHLLEFSFFFEGDGENPQKSQKEIVIAVPAEGLTTYTVINAIIGASSSPASGTVNNAAGKTLIAQLS